MDNDTEYDNGLKDKIMTYNTNYVNYNREKILCKPKKWMPKKCYVNQIENITLQN